MKEIEMERVERQKKPFLLLVDDDAELCSLMLEFFTGGWPSARDGLQRPRGDWRMIARLWVEADLVILDVMLLGIDTDSPCWSSGAGAKDLLPSAADSTRSAEGSYSWI